MRSVNVYLALGGRKPVKRFVKKSISFPEEIFNKIEEKRGKIPRSVYVCDILAEYFKKEEQKQNEQ